MKIETRRTPWFNLAGYLACTVYYDDGSRGTVLQHREVMSLSLGRALLSTEVVHHRNGNKRDNAIDNLELTDRGAHAIMHVTAAEVSICTCEECGCKFERPTRVLRRASIRGTKATFCGKSCVGKHVRKQQIAAGRSNLRS